MNIKLYKRVQDISLELQKELKKNGKGFKHKYFRTEDIVPAILKKCKEYNIGYRTWWEYDQWLLYIFQTDEENTESLTYNLPFIIKEDTSPERTLQLIGKSQTYYKRYLLIQAFDICEDDEIEHIDPEKQDKPKKIKMRGPQTENLPIEKLDEIYGKIIKFCEMRGNDCWERKLDDYYNAQAINDHDYEILTKYLKEYFADIKGGVNM